MRPVQHVSIELLSGFLDKLVTRQRRWGQVSSYIFKLAGENTVSGCSANARQNLGIYVVTCVSLSLIETIAQRYSRIANSQSIQGGL